MEDIVKESEYSSMPLLSRLDHLDFIMKYLEAKQNSNIVKKGSSCSESERQQSISMPLDSAVREAYFKGSLMDRVAFLERRLFQLCLEMESSSTSSQSSVYTICNQQISKSEASTFSTPQPHKQPPSLHPNNQRPQVIKETSCEEEQEKKNSKIKKQKIGKKKKNNNNNRPIEVENTSKSGRKATTSPKWPHWKFLGC